MNLRQALTAIHSFGLSDADIGRRVGAAQSIVHRLRKGEHKTTSFDRGKKIMDLYSEIFQPKQELLGTSEHPTTSTGADK
jgi:hypothetical protein